VLPDERALDESDAASVPWRKDPALLTIGRAALLNPKRAPARRMRNRGIVTSVADPMATAGAI
jgi:hypothetical protein